MTEAQFSDLEGKALVRAEQISDDVIEFETDAGETYRLYHSQDCCESVAVESIVGDLADLIGSPIRYYVASTPRPVRSPPGRTANVIGYGVWQPSVAVAGVSRR